MFDTAKLVHKRAKHLHILKNIVNLCSNSHIVQHKQN